MAREALPEILEAYGNPLCLSKAITSMYRAPSAVVGTTDGSTFSFTTSAGVLHGDSMAPFLFDLCMDAIIRRAFPDHTNGFELERRRSSRLPGKLVSHLLYADDVVLISSMREGAQRLLNRLQEASHPFDLIVNAEKTKSLSLNAQCTSPFHTSHGAVEACSEFTYLGCLIPSTEREMARRKSLAWCAMAMLRPLWQAPIQAKVKGRLFSMLVESILR